MLKHLKSEGDGEISFCGAIEIAGVITIKFDVIKNGQAILGMKGGKSPIYIPGPVQPQFSPGRMLYFVRPLLSPAKHCYAAPTLTFVLLVS